MRYLFLFLPFALMAQIGPTPDRDIRTDNIFSNQTDQVVVRDDLIANEDFTIQGKLITQGESNPCPPYDETGRDALTPSEGDCVLNTDLNQINFYLDGEWTLLDSGSLNEWEPNNGYDVGEIVYVEYQDFLRLFIANTSHVSDPTLFDNDIANWDLLADASISVVDGEATIEGDLTVEGDATFESDLTVEGKFAAIDESNPCPAKTEIERDALTAEEGDCVRNTDTDEINFFLEGEWKLIGGNGAGQGGINYVDVESSTFEGGSIGQWVLKRNATPSDTPTPDDLGTVDTNTSLTVETANPLRGEFSGRLVRGPFDQQGHFIEYEFTIDNTDRNKPLFVSFDYGTEFNYDPDDVLPFIWDREEEELIDLKRSGTSSRFTGRFTARDSRDYSLILHVTRATGGIFNFNYDNVRVTPESVVDFSLEGGMKLIAERELSDTLTSTGVISDLTIEDKLEVGKRYKLNMQIYCRRLDAESSDVNFKGCGVQAKNGTQSLPRINIGFTVQEVFGTSSNSYEFTATSETLEVEALQLTRAELAPSFSGAPATYIQLYEVIETKSALLSESELMNEVVGFYARGNASSVTVNSSNDTETVIYRDDVLFFDPLGGYDPSTGRWTVPETGWYSASASLGLVSGVAAADNARMVVRIRIDEAIFFQKEERLVEDGARQGVSISGAAAFLEKGQEVYTEIQHQSGGDIVVGPQNVTPHFSIMKHPDFSVYAAYSKNEVTTVTSDYTIPSGAQMYTLNVDSATAEITLPAGSRIGTRRLIRKIHNTQGAIEIKTSGSETITRAELEEVELNANGDYWLLEKVSQNRWDLVEGFETGESGEGQYFRYADGRMETYKEVSGIDITNARGEIFRSDNNETYSHPAEFSSVVVANINADGASNWGGNNRTVTNTGGTFRLYSALSFTDVGASIHVVGRWYP